MDEDPQQLAEILEALKATTALGKHLEHAGIWEQWEEIAGRDLGAHTHPMGIKNGVLKVAAAGPVWLHRMAYRKPEILSKINKIVEKEPIEDLFLTLPTREDLKPPQDDAPEGHFKQ